MDNKMEVLEDRSSEKITATAEDEPRYLLTSCIKVWLTENKHRNDKMMDKQR